MNPIIAEIERSGETELPSGARVPIHSHVGSGAGRLIARAVEAAAPQVACEIGLAFGMSTLYILEAMQARGNGRLIGMDPAQHDGTWSGAGLHNVRRAGFADRFEFHEEPSHVVLPRLLAAGTCLQFAFIDGWHTFDHTLVDFFFVDQMLDPGGVIVMDDVSWPAIRRLCQFIVTNRQYSILDVEPLSGRRSGRVALKRLARRLLHPVVRTESTPGPRAMAQEKPLERAQLISLRKEANDSRPFDHFVAF
jgi:predicted O-methyltransferase YrrM